MCLLAAYPFATLHNFFDMKIWQKLISDWSRKFHGNLEISFRYKRFEILFSRMRRGILAVQSCNIPIHANQCLLSTFFIASFYLCRFLLHKIKFLQSSPAILTPCSAFNLQCSALMEFPKYRCASGKCNCVSFFCFLGSKFTLLFTN